MKIELPVPNLAALITTVSRALPSKPVQPITQCILLEAADGRLTATATNLALTITSSVAVSIEHEGIVAIPAARFGAFVGGLEGGTVSLTAADGKVTVRSGTARATLATYDAEDFPHPEFSEGVSAAFDAPLLRASLARVAFAAARKDEGNSALTSVQLTVRDSEATLVAADSFRLSEDRIPLAGLSDAALCVLVPAAACAELTQLLKGEDGSVTLTLNATGTAARFSVGASSLTAALGMGQFPNYAAIIPQTHDTRAMFDAGQLARQARLAESASWDEKLRIFLERREEGDTIRVAASDGEANDGEGGMEVEIEGIENKVGLNAQYLCEVLEALGGRVELVMRAPNMPVVLRQPSLPGFTHVMMPHLGIAWSAS